MTTFIMVAVVVLAVAALAVITIRGSRRHPGRGPSAAKPGLSSDAEYNAERAHIQGKGGYGGGGGF